MNSKVLITGSNGLLGQKLVAILKNDYQILATSTGENLIEDTSQFSYSSLDITDFDSVKSLALSFKPNVIINTAAITNVDGCEDNKELCYDVNVRAVENLSNICYELNAHLIHFSTDFIFDGENGPYKENDIANPLSFYGKSKLESELIVKQSKANSTILRTIILYGTADNLQRNNIVLWGRKALKEGQTLNIIDDQYRSPTLAEDLAMACKLVVEKKAFGVYNVSGKDIMSIFEMIGRMADFYNCSKANINRISSDTLNQKAKRPPKTGFILDKAINELGYKPHSFEQGLQILENQLQ